MAIAEATFPDDPSPLGTPLQITEPEVSIRDFLTVIGITSVTDMFALPSGLYARILGLTTILIAGTTPDNFFLEVTAPTGSGVSDHVAILTQNISGVRTDRVPLRVNFDIIPPGMQVNAESLVGVAATQIRVTFLMIVAPVGAIIIGTRGDAPG